jgi:gamma-glutamyl:cysteine ligase YbdK (ATP-grasp superfamily)
MIVDSHSLNVKPITDRLIHSIAGAYLNEVNCGQISYSNELALHVVGLKTTKPESTLNGLDRAFQEHVERINALLQPLGARLLPTAMHPWMDPLKEMKLWSHDSNPIYESYNRIFDCRGHGWSNLQSSHINLPFCGDEEFRLLHAAIRFILPLMPALAASSPILEGTFSSKMDKRLDVYRYNQKRIPKIAGDVIPEIVTSQNEYQEKILYPMYRDIASFDPEKLLQHEWLNSRGAIARFDRMAIEIRVLDIQECPQADLAIAKAIIFVLHDLISEKWASMKKIEKFPQEILVNLFFNCIDEADMTVIRDEEFLHIFGLSQPLTARELWRYLLTEMLQVEDNHALDVILREGTLARRIMQAFSLEPTSEKLKVIYGQLAYCLEEGTLFCL